MAKSESIPPGNVRLPAVAGRFYPADPEALRGLINSLLAQAPPAAGPAPKALIAPHAGYLYSGPIAASAYAQLIPARERIRRVVLLGPSHYVALYGLATSGAEAFATPLGVVPLDLEATRQVRSRPQVRELDAAHAREHSIEVQLPFLQTILGKFSLIPLAVGHATNEEIAQVLETLWGGPETLVVISSDLSHDNDLQTAQSLDSATAKAIEALRPADIGETHACGGIPIRGLLEVARHRHLRVRTLDLRTSGDTAGPRSRVVGYGAFAFEEGAAA
ncbi:MAG TPA: AmmeMemoRadiSam system protein B [Candidatus Paceibacterota bacterium]|nr:AmmeMemoRadiSam system protein B [Verrucomicrobiota bacterium]HSA09444.1 AmmeMemoRadiSam system protein B [Candidatus Paceibacterota bacterium]